MFYYLEGTVAAMEPNLAVLDCGGVGYACHTTHVTLSALKRGETARLYTYLHVREEVFELYGFYTTEERSCFKLLIGVSGVGPKAALSILSSSTPERLAMAIIMGDERTLTVAPGIGKKIAQRVILELKDKIEKDRITASADPSGQVPVLSGGDKMGEVAAALGVLGYRAAEISKALQGIDTGDLPLEEILRQALKKMVK